MIHNKTFNFEMQQMTKVLLNQIIYSVPKKYKSKCICNKCSAISVPILK